MDFSNFIVSIYVQPDEGLHRRRFAQFLTNGFSIDRSLNCYVGLPWLWTINISSLRIPAFMWISFIDIKRELELLSEGLFPDQVPFAISKLQNILLPNLANFRLRLDTSTAASSLEIITFPQFFNLGLMKDGLKLEMRLNGTSTELTLSSLQRFFHHVSFFHSFLHIDTSSSQSVRISIVVPRSQYAVLKQVANDIFLQNRTILEPATIIVRSMLAWFDNDIYSTTHVYLNLDVVFRTPSCLEYIFLHRLNHPGRVTIQWRTWIHLFNCIFSFATVLPCARSSTFLAHTFTLQLK